MQLVTAVGVDGDVIGRLCRGGVFRGFDDRDVVGHIYRLACRRAAVGTLDDQKALIRGQVRINVKGTFKGSHVRVFSFVFDVGIGHHTRRRRYLRQCRTKQGGVRTALSQSDMRDGQTGGRRRIVDVETGHDTFQRNGDFRDAPADLRFLHSRHDQGSFDDTVRCQTGRIGGFEIGQVGCRSGILGRTVGIDRYGGQAAKSIAVTFKKVVLVRHTDQCQIRKAFQLSGFDRGLIRRARRLKEELVSGRGCLRLRPGFHVIILVITRFCRRRGKKINLQVLYLILTVGSDGLRIFLALTAPAEHQLDLTAGTGRTLRRAVIVCTTASQAGQGQKQH